MEIKNEEELLNMVKEDYAKNMEKQKIENDKKEIENGQSEVMNNRHGVDDPFSKGKNVEDLTEEDEKKIKEVILLPTNTYKESEEYVENLEKLGSEKIKTNFSEKDKLRARTLMDGSKYTVKDNVYVDSLEENKNDLVNNIQYGDKDINLRYPPLGTKGEAVGNVAIAKINSLLNIGEVTQVPLWHSGFWVTLKSPTQKALINLDIALTNSQITLGRETNSLIFSNYQVVFNRILVGFILDHISAYTIKLPEDKQLEDFILIQDYYPLILGILSSMYPNGIYNTRGCVNISKLSDDGSPLCDYVINSTLDPKKLLWVNRKLLTKNMLEHMSQRRTSSVSVDSVIEYQKSITALLEKEVDLETENGVSVKIKLGSPTLAEYVDKGELWVNEIITETESLFTETDSIERKNEKIMNMLSSKLLGVYNTYVKELKFTAGQEHVTVKDPSTIEETLATIGIEEKVKVSYFKAISKYITETAIAFVAIPSYICPKCGADHSESREGPFKAFIPLNLVEHFFVLSAFRISRTRPID